MSDSNPTNTPVHPASAMARIRAGSSVTSMRNGRAPDLVQRPQRLAQVAQVRPVRSQVVIDEDARRAARPPRTPRRSGRDLACDTACASRRLPGSRSRSGCGSRGWQSDWWSSESCFAAESIAWARGPGDSRFHRWPCISARRQPASTSARIRGQSCTPSPTAKRVRVRRALLGTRQHVQSAQHDLASAPAVPLRQFEGPLGERQVDRDPHHLGHRRKRRPPVEQVLVPIPNLPVCRRRRRETGQSERRRKHVLAEARVRIFRVERIDQQGISRPYGSGGEGGIEKRRAAHFSRAPEAFCRMDDGLSRKIH